MRGAPPLDFMVGELRDLADHYKDDGYPGDWRTPSLLAGAAALESRALLLEACKLGLAYMEERGVHDTADRAAPLRAAIAKAEASR